MTVIVFMGNEAGAGVTGNMISIALALASEMNCTITLLENHAGNNGIMNYLKPHENVNCVCEEDYLSSLYRNSLTRSKSEYTVEEIIQDRLYYYGKPAQNQLAHDYGMTYMISEVLKDIKSIEKVRNNFVFVDAKLSGTENSKYLIEKADLIVVNLTQNRSGIRDFLINYPDISEKAVFVVSDFDSNDESSRAEINNLMLFHRNRTFVLPHCSDFRFSAESGDLIEFFNNGWESEQKNWYEDKTAHGERVFYFKSLKNVSRSIMVMLNEIRESKEAKKRV